MPYNRIMTDAHKQAISKAMTGKKHSAETKIKISNSVRQRWMEATPTRPTQATTPTNNK